MGRKQLFEIRLEKWSLIVILGTRSAQSKSDKKASFTLENSPFLTQIGQFQCPKQKSITTF